MTHDPLFSPAWYRVAKLKPRLRAHARIHRHHYRTQRWYVLQDTVSGRNHRFSPAAHTVIALMDGVRNVQEIWDAAATMLGDDIPTQDESIRLLSQLHCADLLQCDVPPDSQELFQRYRQNQSQNRKRRVGNPLALRFALLDPDRFLDRTLPFIRPLFSGPAAAVWVLVVGAALVLAAMHWPELVAQASNRVLTPQSVVLLWLTYTAIKVVHEFGHAFAVKNWGGDVHEMGITLLVLMPLPYVDASFASAFRDKRRRIIVSAAGVLVELFLAALAFFFWLNAQPGAARTLAFDVMLIGSISTFFFNGNPLLKFDGYYVLSDAIGIPNLAGRANRHVGYLCERYLFGIRSAVSPATVAGERTWFVIYGVAAFVYRVFLTFVIAIFVAGKFFVLGIVLALWALYALIVLPVLRYLSYLTTSPRIAPQRSRAFAVTGGILALLLTLTLALPLPLTTRAQGIVWLSEKARVRAGADCFVQRLVVPSNAAVETGQELIECADPELLARIKMLTFRLRELEGRRDALAATDQLRANVIGEEITGAQASLARAQERSDALTIRSPAPGAFVVTRPEDWPGRFLRKGDLIGYVLESSSAVHVIVPQTDIGLVRQRTEGIELRLAHQPRRPVSGSIGRATPAASHALPSMALGTRGGGGIAVDPQDPTGMTTLQKVFRYEIEMPPGAPAGFPGERVYARFDHGVEPVALRWYRSVRNLFLRRFSV